MHRRHLGMDFEVPRSKCRKMDSLYSRRLKVDGEEVFRCRSWTLMKWLPYRTRFALWRRNVVQ